MLRTLEYKGYNIYSYNEKHIILAEKVVDKDYKIIKIIKDTKRNYVALIEIEKKKYIYKEPRNEYRIPQRKFMTLFKKGEVLSTLENIHKLIYEKNIKEYCEIYVAMNKRKYGMIRSSILLMEYFPGKANYSYLDKEVKLLENIHNIGYYHGDFNPGNFLVDKDGNIKIIDTQGKRMFFGRYRAHYDMLTMKMDSYENMKYPYKKDLWYWLALSMKKLKKLTVVEEIKKYKKKLRDKGWKI